MGLRCDCCLEPRPRHHGRDPLPRPEVTDKQSPGSRWTLAELSLREELCPAGQSVSLKSECPLKAGPPQCPPGKDPIRSQGVGPTGLTELPAPAQPIEGLRLCPRQGPGSLLTSERLGWEELLAPVQPIEAQAACRPGLPPGPDLSAKA